MAVSGAFRKGIMRERAHYFHFSAAENAKIADWVAGKQSTRTSEPPFAERFAAAKKPA